MTGAGLDWTRGGNRLHYQRCAACAARWYFRREFCPSCGGRDVPLETMAGGGTVYAATLVTRAPTEVLRAAAPYLIVLVDADDGVRLMAHGDTDLAIGDRVTLSVRAVVDRGLPYATRAV